MILTAFKNLIFPQKCLGCASWGEYLCSHCLNLIKVSNSRICPMCSMPSFGGLTHPRCYQAYGLDGLTAIFSYKGIVGKAITKLKYQFVTDLAETILEIFLSCCGEDKALVKLINKDKTILIPVPLHRQRQIWRGFNQSELLGKMIAEKLGVGFYPNILIRIKKTAPQTKLKKKDRIKNIKGAFRLNKNLPTSHFTSSILLFDDVWTTGSTLKECARVLKRNGFNKVWGLTLARQD
ncbi:hypothetical protein A3J78_00210 [Candidatus Beckwithbacteria bacterium RBG_13_35_6]|uniref:Double zinc ribbon domain-containing protein n=1 Tax=Candidatus Beckwithbacteria bacterium RBG_13_35_6 TaxID=1797456 RepID=A0A1F5DEH9_9BACT|nr:MAG: hypothetical protein A3J78_00210 [Candidatus Beckwithbacteria bacterium RBG_13_35_6]